MGNETDTVDRKSEAYLAARRRLLKASAVAPLIATLSPNTALALSSVAQCAMAPVDISDPDKLVQQQVTLYTRIPWDDLGNGAGSLRQALNNNTSIHTDTDYYLHFPELVYLIDGRYWLEAGPDDEWIPTNDTAISGVVWENYYTTSLVYVVVMFRVYEDGTVNRLGPWPRYQLSDTDPQSSRPLTGSCWNSIDGTPDPQQI